MFFFKPHSDSAYVNKLAVFALIYLLFNVFSQLLLSQTVDIDQSEQMLLSQQWQIGYNAQPPLYTYIVMAIFKVFGVNVVWILLFKAILLWCLVLTMLEIGKVLEFKSLQQFVSVLGLAFIPHIIFHSQRDITHTFLVTLIGALVLWQVFLLSRSASWQRYTFIGVLVAIGLLSKYNFLVFLVGLVLTMLALPKYRPYVLTPKFLLAVAVCFILFLPHFLWSLEHFKVAVSGLQKIEATENQFFAGIISAVVKFFTFFVPLLIFSLPLFLLKQPKPNVNLGTANQTSKHVLSQETRLRQAGYSKFLLLLTAMILVYIFVFTLVSQAQVFKERWFQPLFFYFPLLVALRVGSLYGGAYVSLKKNKGANGSNGIYRAIKLYIGAGVFFLALVAFLLPARIIFASHLKKIDRPSMPYPSLLKAIKADTKNNNKQGIAFIVSDSMLLAGNIRNVFNTTPVITMGNAQKMSPRLSFEAYISHNQQNKAGAVALAICKSAYCDDDGETSKWLEKEGFKLAKLSSKTYNHSYYYANNKGKMMLYVIPIIKQ